MDVIRINYSHNHGFEGHDRLAREFPTIHPVTISVILFVIWYAMEHFGKEITITCLIRSVSENKADGGIEHSSHLTARAGDLSVKTLLLKEVEEIVAVVKKYWGDMICIVYHNAGSGLHLHINVTRAYAVGYTEVIINA